MSNLAFVFPGQGSQKIGMLAELAEQNPIIEKTFNEASEVLGYDMWQLIQQGAQEDINLTQRTQPILLTCEFIKGFINSVFFTILVCFGGTTTSISRKSFVQ